MVGSDCAAPGPAVLHSDALPARCVGVCGSAAVVAKQCTCGDAAFAGRALYLRQRCSIGPAARTAGEGEDKTEHLGLRASRISRVCEGSMSPNSAVKSDMLKRRWRAVWACGLLQR